jgi:hypothetical protein
VSAKTAADLQKMTDSKLFGQLRRWRKLIDADPAFLDLVRKEIDRRAKATDFGKNPEWPGQDDSPKIYPTERNRRLARMAVNLIRSRLTYGWSAEEALSATRRWSRRGDGVPPARSARWSS